MSKPTLLLISDILGNNQSPYLLLLESLLQKEFSVIKIDSCNLGEIINSNEINANHSAFIEDGGLERAVESLSAKYSNAKYIVGYSIGGTIAWRACLEKINPELLVCVSATRLRFEFEKPRCITRLYFGKNDVYRPDEKWSLSNQVETEIQEGGHEIYKEEKFIRQLSEYLKSQFS